MPSRCHLSPTQSEEETVLAYCLKKEKLAKQTREAEKAAQRRKLKAQLAALSDDAEDDLQEEFPPRAEKKQARVPKAPVDKEEIEEISSDAEEAEPTTEEEAPPPKVSRSKRHYTGTPPPKAAKAIKQEKASDAPSQARTVKAQPKAFVGKPVARATTSVSTTRQAKGKAKQAKGSSPDRSVLSIKENTKLQAANPPPAKAKRGNRNTTRLVDNYALVSSHPFLDHLPALFKVARSFSSNTLPAGGDCISCKANFLACGHRFKAPAADVEAATTNVEATASDTAALISCASCARLGRPHCTHAKPAGLAQYLAEVLRLYGLSSESHLCVSSRNISVGITELASIRKLYSLVEARVISDTARHAAEILAAKAEHENDPGYFVGAGLISSKDQLPDLFSICESFFPSGDESPEEAAPLQQALSPQWLELPSAIGMVPGSNPANRALLLFIEEVNGLKEGGNVWPSLPEHPGFLPSSDELHDRRIAVDAALLAGDLHPLNAIAGPSGSSISEARASATPKDTGGYFSLSQTGEVLTTIDPALLAIVPPNVTAGEGEEGDIEIDTTDSSAEYFVNSIFAGADMFFLRGQDLDDNVANFYHRLDRLKQKQTTKTSVLNALTAIVPVCESMLQRLAIDPAALEHPSIFQLLRRGRRCFEIWQNDHDNSYRMPSVHNRIKSTLAQKSRTQAAADTDAAPATPVIPAKVPMDLVHAEAVPPKKKRRSGKLPKSAETVASSDEEGENAEEVVICNHNPEERVLTLPENSAAMQVDNEGGPVEATVTTDTTVPVSGSTETASGKGCPAVGEPMCRTGE
ncbi:hypothetical protein AGABI2DRAFT_146423 [Agaricus bisporus var. bisporus H97]|uniref:hypothetical protein n=1 Tax=Agaricus bisporus var. bisporus (strain H97 / ATCC MYA-4626 / FGSC 10389) TaxID=936046 RepID=UPI00029F6A73|nr:hypothetical protein AGABI2DRAFT_146423 [Agaricus bisporus var. bisporus H97]EKV42970.1 hypothetical protein AGABI2DRAFT_146423 [Agaricus bisporus var. bisporus H97]